MIAENLGEFRIVQHPLMLLALAELAHHVGRDPEKIGERIAYEIGIAHAHEPGFFEKPGSEIALPVFAPQVDICYKAVMWGSPAVVWGHER
jgi:hypothetical protein